MEKYMKYEALNKKFFGGGKQYLYFIKTDKSGKPGEQKKCDEIEQILQRSLDTKKVLNSYLKTHIIYRYDGNTTLEDLSRGIKYNIGTKLCKKDCETNISKIIAQIEVQYESIRLDNGTVLSPKTKQQIKDEANRDFANGDNTIGDSYNGHLIKNGMEFCKFATSVSLTGKIGKPAQIEKVVVNNARID